MDEAPPLRRLRQAAAPSAPALLQREATEWALNLLRPLEPRVLVTCAQFVGEGERAAEVADEVLHLAARRLVELDDVDHEDGIAVWGWLYAILRARCLQALGPPPDVLTTDGVLPPHSEVAHLYADLRDHQRVELIVDVSRQILSPEAQEAVYLRYVEGASPTTIAAVLRLGEGGGEAMLARCRQPMGRALRLRLAEELSRAQLDAEGEGSRPVGPEGEE
ncbi:MAG: hypothetical protein AAF211_21975 [Myxococcota bacterium]